MSSVRRTLHPDELPYLTAHELAIRIRRRELSPVEVAYAFIRRIESRKASLNALVHLDVGGAHVRAREAERAPVAREPFGLLYGVPSAHKALFDLKPGLPASLGDIRALRHNVVNAHCAFRERIEKRGWPQRLKHIGVELAAFALLSIALLTTPTSASALTSTAASVHQYEYCRYLTNGFIRVCEFDTLAQCKATSSRCERYPFLMYCHVLNGQIQRCDFDSLVECVAASLGLAGDCERSPFLRGPETPAPTNQKPQHSKWKSQLRSKPH